MAGLKEHGHFVGIGTAMLAEQDRLLGSRSFVAAEESLHRHSLELFEVADCGDISDSRHESILKRSGLEILTPSFFDGIRILRNSPTEK